MSWYIGQEIICIKSHSCGIIKRGQTFIIKGLSSSRCKCSYILIDIGIVSKTGVGECTNCNQVYRQDDIWWLREELFSPLDFDISELVDIINQPCEYQHVNQNKS